MRKRLLILLLSLILSASVFVGISFVMGILLKSRITDLVTHYDVSPIQISVKNYDKGLFRSKATMDVFFNNADHYVLELHISHMPLSTLGFLKTGIHASLNQEFLGEQQNVIDLDSVFTVFGDVRSQFLIKDLSNLIYENLGFYNKGEDKDIHGSLTFSDNKIILGFTGEAQELESESSGVTMQSSDLSLVTTLSQSPPGDQGASVEWLTDVDGVISGKNLKTDLSDPLQLALSDPTVHMNYQGSLMDLYDLYRWSLGEDAKISGRLALQLKNSTGTMSLSDLAQEFQMQGVLMDLSFGNDDSGKIKVQHSVAVSDFLLKIQDQEIKFSNLNTGVMLNAKKDVFYQLLGSESYGSDDPYVIINTLLQRIEAEQTSVALENLAVKGFNLGDLSFKKGLVSLALDSKEDQKIGSYAMEVDNFVWKNEAQNYKAVVDDSTVQGSYQLNLTQMMDNLLKKDGTVYEMNGQYAVNIPHVEFSHPADNQYYLIQDMVGEGKIQSTLAENGALNAQFKVGQLIAKQLDWSFILDKLTLTSAMQQAYRGYYAGQTQRSLDNLAFSKGKIGWGVQEVTFDTRQAIDQKKLNLYHDLRINHVLSKDKPDGSCLYQGSYEDISLDQLDKLWREVTKVDLSLNPSTGQVDQSVFWNKFHRDSLDLFQAGFKTQSNVTCALPDGMATLKNNMTLSAPDPLAGSTDIQIPVQVWDGVITLINNTDLTKLDRILKDEKIIVSHTSDHHAYYTLHFEYDHGKNTVNGKALDPLIQSIHKKIKGNPKGRPL